MVSKCFSNRFALLGSGTTEENANRFIGHERVFRQSSSHEYRPVMSEVQNRSFTNNRRIVTGHDGPNMFRFVLTQRANDIRLYPLVRAHCDRNPHFFLGVPSEYLIEEIERAGRMCCNDYSIVDAASLRCVDEDFGRSSRVEQDVL